MTEEYEAQVAQARRDPHRPAYHFLPPANWLNDPNGLIQWQGEYHLFYQYNPYGAFHQRIHWGHAVSKDLVHWTHLPVALTPTPGADEDGCWSGCAVNDNGTPTLIYTGSRAGDQRPCLATSTDDLRTWEKWPGNPIIPAPPPDLELIGFRDHSVWKEGDSWYQLVGAGIKGVGGATLLYRSPDLRQWTYLHPLYVGDLSRTTPLWLGSMWECADFFPLGDKHILVVSVWNQEQLHYSTYQTGSYADHRFTPETVHKLDFGDNYFYAPQTMRDDQGRRLIWAWIQEGRSLAAQRAAAWSGAMSLPRVLTLRADGLLGMEPAPELTALRGAHHPFAARDLAPDQPQVLGEVQGDTLEIVAEFDPGDAQQVGLKVRCAPGGEEETFIYYDVATGRLAVDRARSSLDPDVEQGLRDGPLAPAPGEPLTLRVFLDRSIIEVYANGRACLTCRVYPTRPDSQGVAVVVTGGSARLKALDIWALKSIWPAEE